MKIRIKGNSIRYRMSKSDIDQLAERGMVSEKVDFPGRSFVYELVTNDGETMTAAYQDNTIRVYIPASMSNELQDPERIGQQGDDGNISILVEKDFVCLDNTIEDQSDFFPHPGMPVC